MNQADFLTSKKFDLEMQIQKLEHILSNSELALSLLEDAYLDFYLFVNFLTKVNIQSKIIEDTSWVDFFGEEAEENTQILSLAKKFAGLKQE